MGLNGFRGVSCIRPEERIFKEFVYERRADDYAGVS